MGKAKRYQTVADMVRDVSEEHAFGKDVERRISSRRLVKKLFALRSERGLSQRDVAQKLGCSQSRVSKLEASVDSDLRLGDLNGYIKALDLDLSLVVSPENRTAAGLVKYHAFSIKRLLDRLAVLARGDDKIAKGVAGFFGEAFFNLVRLLQDSASRLPKQPDDRPYFQIELYESDLADTADVEVGDEQEDVPQAAPEPALFRQGSATSGGEQA